MVDLKSLFSGKGAEELYWALIIEPNWVQAAIWKIEEGQAEVISLSPSVAWESEEEMVNSCDTVLSTCIQYLPEDIKEPTKTVFGVNGSWVSGGQIKEEHLAKIKKVCSDLSLQPVGFVVLAEAIAHLTKSEEGTPLNAVVLGVQDEEIELTVFRLGNMQGMTQIARSVSIAGDVAEGLVRFATNEPFPSRFILYNGKEGELEDVRQELLAVNWSDYPKINILHTPKLEIISSDRKASAVCLAGAAEIAQVSRVVKLTHTDDQEENQEPEVEEKISPEEENVRKVENPEELGFVLEKDVETLSEDEKKKMPDEAVPKPSKSKFPIFSIATTFFARVAKKVKSIFIKKTQEKSFSVSPKSQKLKNKILALLIVLGVLFLGTIIFWWYFSKAEMVIYVSPKSLEEKFSIFVDPNLANVNFSTSTLPGKVIEESVSGERTTTTSGKITVGEMAKGQVTISRSGPEVQLPAGTILTGPNNLKFSLNDPVKVASGTPSLAGKAKANVTAVEFGPAYNLAAGEKFKVGIYSSFEMDATNESAFSGGSSREVSSVSQSDQKKLEEDLTQELLDKAKEVLAGKVTESEYFIKESATMETVSKNFSSKVGDEASDLKLNLSLKAKGLTVNKTNLQDFTKEILKSRIPGGFSYKEDEIDIKFEPETEKDGIFELKVSILANLLPEIKQVEIADKIAGKKTDYVREYLTIIPGFSEVKIFWNPKYFKRFNILPKVAKNISVKVQTQK